MVTIIQLIASLLISLQLNPNPAGFTITFEWKQSADGIFCEAPLGFGIEQTVILSGTAKDSGLNMRSLPSVSGSKVGVLKDGETASIHPPTPGDSINNIVDWYYVELPDKQGYVSGAFIDVPPFSWGC